MPVLLQSWSLVQAKALYQRMGRQRPSFWRGLEAAVDCEPLARPTVRRSMGSRSLRADLEALRADRDQALSQLLNA
ncbi:hypothetical protein SynRS9909_01207 [Synechococcus sp. RS9909]|nr:hypothetical protein RS9917_13928 [Synechococcus sp. RS9917]QNI79195.1 hypothetical protein SynRS9909_01207 [Synechococcus sp. RS9909]